MTRLVSLAAVLALAAASQFLLATSGQNTAETTIRPTESTNAVLLGLSPAVRDLPVVDETFRPDKFTVRPEHEWTRQRSSTWRFRPDPVVQLHDFGPKLPSPVHNYAGISNLLGIAPPDTNGDVGPTRYVQAVNRLYAVYDKATGIRLAGPVDINTIFAGSGDACTSSNNGDPTVLYDRAADRWLISEFGLPYAPNGPFFQCMAISKTSDPAGEYYRYRWYFTTWAIKLNDYPQFGVWPDGYYMSINMFNYVDGSWGGAGIVVFERAKMLLGQVAQGNLWDMYSVDPSLGGMLPASQIGQTPPPAGTPNFFAKFDDDYFGYPHDQLEVLRVHVDWNNLDNSWVSAPTLLQTRVFNSVFRETVDGAPQKGTKQRLALLSGRLMHAMPYRNRGSYASLLLNHTVNVSKVGGRAGIRWYELRIPTTGTPIPYIHQQGTFAPLGLLWRWMGSISMDKKGDIALGYSASSSLLFPSIRYAGRTAGSPLGTMGGEVVLKAGTGSQAWTDRWGDYSMMSIDPSDDCTFWYTSQYQSATDGPWRTRIGAFKVTTCS